MPAGYRPHGIVRASAYRWDNARFSGSPVIGFDTSLSVHHDFDEVNSLYARGQDARAFELRRDLHLESALWLGWSDADLSEWLYRTRVGLGCGRR